MLGSHVGPLLRAKWSAFQRRLCGYGGHAGGKS